MTVDLSLLAVGAVSIFVILFVLDDIGALSRSAQAQKHPRRRG
jgi:hypothetical protein